MIHALYEVGGCIRDDLLGLHSKDIDFAVEANSYLDMRSWLEAEGFEIFVEQPEFLTIRARFPRHPWSFGAKEMSVLTCDFVLCRKESTYTDGRRPDDVQPGTIYDDLARRDFTINAMARTADGTLLDPWAGQIDLRCGLLRAVGDPALRLHEDALRAVRALRFSVTKQLQINWELMAVLRSDWLPPLLTSVSVERRREELRRMFRYDNMASFRILAGMPRAFQDALFADGLWLDPSLKH